MWFLPYYAAASSMGNSLTQWSGASVTLFENNHAPDVHGTSIALHPGTENKIAVGFVNITKLPWEGDKYCPKNV